MENESYHNEDIIPKSHDLGGCRRPDKGGWNQAIISYIIFLMRFQVTEKSGDYPEFLEP